MKDTPSGETEVVTTPSAPDAQGEEGQAPAESTTTSSSQSVEVQPTDWDSDANPWKVAASDAQRRWAEVEKQQIAAAGEEYSRQLVTQGMTPEQAKQVAGIAVQQEIAQRQVAAERTQLEEQAKPLVAQRIVEEIKKVHGVDISPRDLLYYTNGAAVKSPQEMLARADALVTMGKRGQMDARRMKGQDKLDGGSTPASPPSIGTEKLTPTQRFAKWLSSESK